MTLSGKCRRLCFNSILTKPSDGKAFTIQNQNIQQKMDMKNHMNSKRIYFSSENHLKEPSMRGT